MSHISKIELRIQSLEDLKLACNHLGLEFRENQKTYRWFGRWVGDVALPEGIREEDLGKCDHAIHVPGAQYQVGVIKRENDFLLLWDSWKVGGLTKVLGENAGKLKQAYAVERIKRKSRIRGLHMREQKMKHGIRITLTA